MAETILGTLLIVFVLLYVLDYFGMVDLFGTLVETFRLLFRALRYFVSGVARVLRG